MDRVLPTDVQTIIYRFRSPEGWVREFRVELEKPSLKLRPPAADKPLPAWTALEHHQCANCPLAPGHDARCPVAANLVPVIDAFRRVLSHEESDVEVETPSRTYSARVKNTLAVGSLMGIYMATSGCPIMDRLRPMVLTHTPFPTVEESTFRSMASYLMAQYFLHRSGGEADWELAEFPDFYDQIATVNQYFVKRLSTATERDASLNAVVFLNCFAAATQRTVARERFGEFEALFSAFLGDWKAAEIKPDRRT
ncbi:MAG: hypothetical protein SFU53_10465 [Terrimicrobiaceae bacterium]|nr:hypothetical protein [Terrimicrobiaceae bacterium]